MGIGLYNDKYKKYVKNSFSQGERKKNRRRVYGRILGKDPWTDLRVHGR